MHDEFDKQLAVFDGWFVDPDPLLAEIDTLRISFDRLFAGFDENLFGFDQLFVELMATYVGL